MTFQDLVSGIERRAALGGQDARLMAAAIALARRGLGLCAPNPAVGALVVRDGVIIGRGWTQPGGRPHAETEALRQAGEASRGATLYVTLEPCSHHGRTPPCAEAIVAAGLTRVVSAIEDPDPRVAGRGHDMLRRAGLDVRVGVGAEAALDTNLGHVLRVTRKRPAVRLKLALTADGFVAEAPRPEGIAPRLAVTGAAAHRQTHMLRAMHDAILIGAGTARDDDPKLTVRLAGLEARRPRRVVLDARLTLSPRSYLARTARDAPTLLLAGPDAPDGAEVQLAAEGVEIVRAPADASGRIDARAALELLAGRGITQLLCEAGPRLAESLFAADLVDEAILYVSPHALGRPGLCGLTPERAASLDDPARFALVERRAVGEDLVIRRKRIC